MQSALDAILLDIPRAAAVWLLVLTTALSAVAAVTLSRRRTTAPSGTPAPARAAAFDVAQRAAAVLAGATRRVTAVRTARRLGRHPDSPVLDPSREPRPAGDGGTPSPSGDGGGVLVDQEAGAVVAPGDGADDSTDDSTVDLTTARRAVGLGGEAVGDPSVYLDNARADAGDWDAAWDELAGEPVDADELMTADDQWRYAGEIAVVADRAAETADRLRRQWAEADRAAEAAWAAFDAADRAARRARAATAFPATRVAPHECERYLHRAAVAACRRRELGVAELSEVLAHRGWDPTRQPVEQEAALRQLVRDGRLRAYLDAADRERQAWHAADVAAAAVCSLRDEAFAARQRAELRPADSAAVWLDEQLHWEVPQQRRGSLVRR